MVDEYVTEAVLAKVERRRAVPRDDQVWAGEAELRRLETKLSALRQQWTADEITDGFFFATVRQVEQRLGDLRNEHARHVVATARAASGLSDVRSRWHGGGLDLSQKRAIVREALLAVVIQPIGHGGRSAFNPDLLQLVWRP
jgi:hypothetical protein